VLDWKRVATPKGRRLKFWHLEERVTPKGLLDRASGHETRRKRLLNRATEFYTPYDTLHPPIAVNNIVINCAPNAAEFLPGGPSQGPAVLRDRCKII
jgi:hypothetical protein